MTKAISAFVLLCCMVSWGCGEFTVTQQIEDTSDTTHLKDNVDDVPLFDGETCSYDQTDEYEPRSRFGKGPFTGECLDTEKRRPISIRSSPNQSDILSVANFYHRGGYWIAHIPLDAVKTVYFQLEYFPAVVPAGHTQLRVEFDRAIELEGHSAWNENETDEIFNLVLSVEAVPRIGDRYDLFRGMRNHFGLAFRMTSLQARYASMIETQGHHVEQWQLNITAEESRELLLFYAYESEALGLEETYHTLFRNCTTELIRALDSVVQYTAGEQIKRFLLKVTEFYPNIVRGALIARGLLPIDQSTDWYPLETDPSYPID